MASEEASEILQSVNRALRKDGTKALQSHRAILFLSHILNKAI